MNGVLSEQKDAAGGMDRTGVEYGILGNDNDLETVAFTCPAEDFDVNFSRRGGGNELQICERLGIIGRGAVVGGFGGSPPIWNALSVACERKGESVRARSTEIRAFILKSPVACNHASISL